MEEEAARRVQEEQQRLAEEAGRARRAVEEMLRLRDELEHEKLQAEAEATSRRHEEEERLRLMQVEAERRLREEERKLEESYAWQAEELGRLQRMKEAAELQLVEERERLKADSQVARQRLAEAQRIQSEVESARLAGAHEAELRQQRQLELERKLREEIQAKVDSERRRLEAEFARNAEELGLARREKAAAEAARIAAAEEAERIVFEYKQSHQKLREREEAKLEAERARLEADGRQLREALLEAQAAKGLALLTQQRAEQQITELAAARAAQADGSTQARLASDIVAIEEELSAARAQIAAADAEQDRMELAARAHARHLEQHRQDEAVTRNRFEQEVESWLREQEGQHSSPSQSQMLANQKAHLERITKRAQKARDTAKAHDQALIQELASRLRDD